MTQKRTESLSLVVVGFQAFMNKLTGATVTHAQLVQAFKEGSEATGAVAKGLGTVATAASALGTVLASALLAGLYAVKKGFEAVTRSIQGAIGALKGWAIAAAEVEGPMKGFAGFAHDMELGVEGMLKKLKDMSGGMFTTRELLLSFNRAASLVSRQFAETLPGAMDMIAKISVSTGQSFDYLMNSYVMGVGRMSKVIIDNLQVTVQMSEVQAKANEMYGKAYDALTKSEQQMAYANVTLEKMKANTAGMSDVTNTAAMNLKRIDATFRDLGQLLGQFLLPAWTTLTKAVSDFTLQISAAVQEGGFLYPILIKIGAGFAVLADYAAEAIQWVTDILKVLSGASDGLLATMSKAQVKVLLWLHNLVKDVDEGMGSLVEGLLNWGIEAVTAFATGIIQATGTALVTAMNGIGSLLSWYLSPGSPPRVAPGLTSWGIAAMDSYLSGFGMADFGILEDVQKHFKNILGDKKYAEVSQDLIGMLAAGGGVGGVGEDFFAKIRESGGKFGLQLEDLARKQVALATATEGVAKAEKQLENLRKQAERSQKKIGKEVARYNELLREGAGRDILNDQLKRVNAAEGIAAADLEILKSTTEQAEVEQESTDHLKEEVDLQQKLLNQLMGIDAALLKAQEAKEKLLGGAPGGAGAGIADLVPEVPREAFDFENKIGAAIERMKATMKEKLEGIFQPIVDAYNKDWKPTFDKVIAAWNQLLYDFGEFSQDPNVIAIKNFFAELFPEGTLATFLGIAGALAAVGIIASVIASPLALLAIPIAVLAGLWAGHNKELKTTVFQLDYIAKHYAKKVNLIEDENTGTIAALGESWTTFWTNSRKGWEGYFREQKLAFALWGASVISSTEQWKSDLITKYNELITDAKAGWDQLWLDITTAAEGPILVFEGFVTAVKNFYDWLLGKVFSFKIQMPELPAWATPGSPLPIHTAWQAFAKDMSSINARLQVPSVTPQMQLLAPSPSSYGASRAGGGAAASPASVMIQFGDVTVTGEADEDRLAHKIRKEVMKAMRGS